MISYGFIWYLTDFTPHGHFRLYDPTQSASSKSPQVWISLLMAAQSRCPSHAPWAMGEAEKSHGFKTPELGR